MQAKWKKYTLEFKRPAGTSRGVLQLKESWFIRLIDDEGRMGIGECGLLKGLSTDDRPDYEAQLNSVCADPNFYLENFHQLAEFPSIQAGLEMAYLDLKSDNDFQLFDNDFSTSKSGIPINGLIWMGDTAFMREQIREKLDAGFNCLKMKIGALDFDQECSILQEIRNEASADELVLRVDANGAFAPHEAMSKLERLSRFDLHSIEQPIRQGQWDSMCELCKNSPIAIALDEELIGIFNREDKIRMLDSIQPQYIILKPSFVGGFRGSDEWIELCEERKIGWWATSALESNVGLNAIAQWTGSKGVKMHQGLGTGQLYTNNFPSPLEIQQGQIHYRKDLNWDLRQLSL